MKIKVGDRVRIKRVEAGAFSEKAGFFVPTMEKSIGNKYEVIAVGDYGEVELQIGYLTFLFDPEWLEIVEEETKTSILADDYKSILAEDYKSILAEAESILNGQREVDYGDATESFEKIAQLASLITNKVLDAETCCAVMMAVKLTRESFKHKRDNLVDLAGYAEILNQIKNKSYEYR